MICAPQHQLSHLWCVAICWRAGQVARSSRGTATLRRCPPRSGVLAGARLTARASAATRSVAPSSWRRIGQARTCPARLVDRETQACQIVGDEFHDRLRSPGTGLHPAQWLRALAEETGAALRATLAQGADDWQNPWALLCGLALSAPRTPADAVDETIRERLPEFPDIKDPLETALAEAAKFAE